MNKLRNIAAQVEQGMQLDGAFGLAKFRPRKQRKAQIDGAGVESVNRVVQFYAKVFVGTEGGTEMRTWAKSA